MYVLGIIFFLSICLCSLDNPLKITQLANTVYYNILIQSYKHAICIKDMYCILLYRTRMVHVFYIFPYMYTSLVNSPFS